MKKIEYREWYIQPLVFPEHKNSWTAYCEIERLNADGPEMFQNVVSVTRKAKQEAIDAACNDARHLIDSIIASPTPIY